jgi:hypothetical protein
VCPDNPAPRFTNVRIRGVMPGAAPVIYFFSARKGRRPRACSQNGKGPGSFGLSEVSVVTLALRAVPRISTKVMPCAGAMALFLCRQNDRGRK